MNTRQWMFALFLCAIVVAVALWVALRPSGSSEPTSTPPVQAADAAPVDSPQTAFPGLPAAAPEAPAEVTPDWIGQIVAALRANDLRLAESNCVSLRAAMAKDPALAARALETFAKYAWQSTENDGFRVRVCGYLAIALTPTHVPALFESELARWRQPLDEARAERWRQAQISHLWVPCSSALEVRTERVAASALGFLGYRALKDGNADLMAAVARAFEVPQGAPDTRSILFDPVLSQVLFEVFVRHKQLETEGQTALKKWLSTLRERPDLSPRLKHQIELFLMEPADSMDSLLERLRKASSEQTAQRELMLYLQGDPAFRCEAGPVVDALLARFRDTTVQMILIEVFDQLSTLQTDADFAHAANWIASMRLSEPFESSHGAYLSVQALMALVNNAAGHRLKPFGARPMVFSGQTDGGLSLYRRLVHDLIHEARGLHRVLRFGSTANLPTLCMALQLTLEERLQELARTIREIGSTLPSFKRQACSVLLLVGANELMEQSTRVMEVVEVLLATPVAYPADLIDKRDQQHSCLTFVPELERLLATLGYPRITAAASANLASLVQDALAVPAADPYDPQDVLARRAKVNEVLLVLVERGYITG